MKYIIGLLILIFCLNSFANPEINVRAESFVEDSKITFGDIAEFKNFSEENELALKSLEIGNSPQAGETRKFTGFGLSEILRYGLVNISNAKIIIPKEVIVRPKYFKLSQSEVEQKIAAWVEQECQPCQIKFTNINIPKFDGVTGAAKWDIVKTGRAPRGSFFVGLQVQDPNQVAQKFWVGGELRIFKKVPVLKKLVSSAGRIQPEDYAIETRDVTFFNDAVPTEIEMHGSELSKIMGANEIIWKSNLKRRMVMQRGQAVNIVMKADAWNVNIKGVSQGFGYVGDLVKVLNPNTNKVLVGVVLDEGTIEVK